MFQVVTVICMRSCELWQSYAAARPTAQVRFDARMLDAAQNSQEALAHLISREWEAGMQDRPQRPQVVIVGAGFGGLEACKVLAKVEVDVTLVATTASSHFFIRSRRRRCRLLMWPGRSAPSCAIRRTCA
jgi:hypothetical protein